METTLSVVVPAYNEEKNIEATVAMLEEAMAHNAASVTHYELLLIDNGSHDHTARIIDSLAESNSHVVPVHLMPNVGFGGAYWEGVKRARYTYVIVIPGDNETDPRTLDNLFHEVGKADMILTYSVNPEVRSLKRQIISNSFTILLNILLGLNLKYYNGVSLHRRDILKTLLEQQTPTYGHGFNAELVATLVKSGYTYKEVPMYIRPRLGAGKAFEVKNVIRVLKTVASLFWKLRILRQTISV